MFKIRTVSTRLLMRCRFLVAISVVPLLAIACDNTSGPGVTLHVVPDTVQLLRNDSLRLSVDAVDGDGHLVTVVTVSSESIRTTIVTVTNLGVVHSNAVLG